MHRTKGDLAVFASEMMKSCCVTPKISDEDLDNPAAYASSELDWLYSQITAFDLASNLTSATQPPPTPKDGVRL